MIWEELFLTLNLISDVIKCKMFDLNFLLSFAECWYSNTSLQWHFKNLLKLATQDTYLSYLKQIPFITLHFTIFFLKNERLEVIT